MTTHRIFFGDAAEVIRSRIGSETIQLMVTSPPYWKVRDYGHAGQIGYNESLPEFLDGLSVVWKEVVRSLMPDGKLAVNIGNIYYTVSGENRRTTANLSLLVWEQLSLLSNLRFMGTIYWKKTTSRAGAVLFGSYPYPANFMISNAVEPIFVFRKAGKRRVDHDLKELSKISLDDFRRFRDAIWEINGAAADKHAAAFPLEIPRRLIKMYSFVGDTVLDPFSGSGTTARAAAELGRTSIGIEINRDFLPLMQDKIGLVDSPPADKFDTFEIINTENGQSEPWYKILTC